MLFIAAKQMSLLRRGNKCAKNIIQSVISDYLLTCDCNINSDDFTILCKGRLLCIQHFIQHLIFVLDEILDIISNVE